jgi:hypothetical protein
MVLALGLSTTHVLITSMQISSSSTTLGECCVCNLNNVTLNPPFLLRHLDWLFNLVVC